MYTLGIETSTSIGSVALMCGDEVLHHVCFGRVPAHERHLLPHIDRLLRCGGVAKAQVDTVAVGVGPGAFTGLRVGVTCAKVLSYALHWKPVGVCSLEVMARSVADAERIDNVPVCAVRDARRGAVYGRVILRTSDGWRPEGPVMIDTPSALAARLARGTVVTGTGVEAYPDIFDPVRFRCVPAGERIAASYAVTAARLGVRARPGADPGVSAMQLAPCYYRLTAIEERVRAQEARVS